MRRTMQSGARVLTLPGTILAALLSAGCVQVTAPTDPITINLNINIRQEVVYRLDGDARELIQQNTEIF
jgi:hypothetical protein